MASSASPALAERADIHKSCKSLEAIVNIFNDYCQAIDAIVTAQKKLAKALREAAGLKAMHSHAGGAMNTIANVFEALTEVDTKFMKLADKECEGVSSDLKKWFKKLAKEEKTHDDRIVAANMKIKAAGQAYEKKAKRRDLDAMDEHTRYINLLSSIGPEMSQDKYNHALFVTQRHTTTVFTIASCLARLADAEWSRSCESVRRISPLAGPVGEARAYLEGGWTGNVPNDLQDPATALVQPVQEQRTATQDRPHLSRPTSAAPTLQSLQSIRTDTTGMNEFGTVNEKLPPPSRPTAHITTSDSVRSLESLSSFPTPPAHFPLPDLANPGITGQQTEFSAGTKSPPEERPQGLTVLSDRSQEKLVESPRSTSFHGPSPTASQTNGSSLSAEDRTLPTIKEDSPPAKPAERSYNDVPTLAPAEDKSVATPFPTISPRAGETSPNSSALNRPRTTSFSRNDQADLPSNSASGSPPNDRSSDRDRAFKRSDSTGSGSIVAAMRDRYTRPTGPPSSPPRDVPRVPYSVSDLAARYSPIDTRVIGQNPWSNEPSASQHVKEDSKRRSLPLPADITSAPSTTPSVITERRRQIDEMEQGLRDRERELKEREIDLRARELDLDRAKLLEVQASLSGSVPGGATARPQTHNPRPYSQHSYSATSLVAPRVTSRPLSQYDAPPVSPIDLPLAEHGAYCSCARCSAAKYSNASTPILAGHDLPAQTHAYQPTNGAPDKSEKSKGWIRRLSMPVVGNAFSSDKKTSPTTPHSAGLQPRSPNPVDLRLALTTQDGRYFQGTFQPDSTGGISNVTPRPRKISFGRRKE